MSAYGRHVEFTQSAISDQLLRIVLTQPRSAIFDSHPFSGSLNREGKYFAIEVEVKNIAKKRLTLSRCQTPY
jgi:hypothetical protein